MMQNKNILLGVSGGIAAYKACGLTSKLTQSGANVKVMMTENACKFVSPLTFQALSRNPVYVDTFEESDFKKIAHIDLADWADFVIIAPATANVIGKIAQGIADDMLTTTILAAQAPIYIAPAMNVHMYQHPAVISNMQKLADWGCRFIEPGDGYLACGYVGRGRLEEPERIIAVIEKAETENMLLAGKNVLISAGPTREKIDPVRFFSNRSSGKMGFALAEAAANMGANVTLVAGPVSLEINNPRINRVNVTTAEEMYSIMHEHFQRNDIVIKAAAVADYKPKVSYDQKMKKQGGEWHVEMERTKDILHSLGEMKTTQFLVGFAAETSNIWEYGKNKLHHKNLNAIVMNDVSAAGAGFGTDTNAVVYLNQEMMSEEIALTSKTEIARKIMRLIDHDMKKDETT